MKYGSLFSGIGGFDLGLDRAGLSCAWQVEKDPMAAGVLNYHWPDVPVYDDVETFGKASVPDGTVDLICGGFPCQDLSVAGRRAGLAGKRSGLFHEFMRLASEFSPRWLLIENVPGLLSSDGGRDMGIVTSTLAGLGYGWAYRILDAQYFGLAQRRRRLFIVGCLGEPARAAKVLFESDSLPGNSAPGRAPGPDTAGRIAACLNAGGNNGGFRTEPGEYLVAQPLRAGRQFSDMGNGESNVVVGTLSAHSPRHGHAMTTQQAAESGHLIAYPDPAYAVSGNGSKFGSGRDNQDAFVVFDTTQITSSGNYSNPQPGDPCHPLAAGAHPPVLAFTERGREGGRSVEWLDDGTTYAPTNPGDGGRTQSRMIAYNWQSGGDVRHNFNAENSPALSVGQVPAVGVRRLTPRECERLQGFPDDWTRWRTQNGKTVEQSDSARYRQLGNAIAVPVAEWIARRIIEKGQ